MGRGSFSNACAPDCCFSSDNIAPPTDEPTADMEAPGALRFETSGCATHTPQLCQPTAHHTTRTHCCQAYDADFYFNNLISIELSASRKDK